MPRRVRKTDTPPVVFQRIAIPHGRARLAAVLGFAIALAVTGGTVIRVVQAATYVGPTAAPPLGNIPVTIWNRASTTVKQTNAAIDIDGAGPAPAATSVGTTPVGLTVGATTLNMGSADAGQNLIYGVADAAKIGAGDSLLLLQTFTAPATYTTRFRIDQMGNMTTPTGLNATGYVLSGYVTAGNTSRNLNVADADTFVGLFQARYDFMHPQDWLLWGRTWDNVAAAWNTRLTLNRDGNLFASGSATYGTNKLDLGVAAPGQNVYYGVADYTKMHPDDYLMLLQTYDPGTLTYSNRVVVDRDGDVTADGNLNADACFGPVFHGVSKTAADVVTTYNGNLNAGGAGYYNANSLCVPKYGAGAHVCSTAEIMNSIKCATAGSAVKTVATDTDAWIQDGPPGYTAPANDCQGWSSALGTNLGRMWRFNQTTGGKGYLTTCNAVIPLTCCK